jgi:uracil-DNA glycosylase
VAFLLWGRHARSHRAEIEVLRSDHLILEAPHPSPLSAHRGFFGCGHFSAVNRWLSTRGETPIEWFGDPW